jgi:NAD-dependent oxidoreductase involved in siderophore biosynthesis
MVFILSAIGNRIDNMAWELADNADKFANACSVSIVCNLLDLTMLALAIVVTVSVTGKCRSLYATVSEPRKA